MESSSGIHVDVLRGDNRNVPLCAETEGGPTLLRIPRGVFFVAVTSQKPTDVKVVLDQAHAFTTRVRAGRTVIEGDDDQVRLVFGDPGLVDHPQAHVTRTGLVEVSVRHTAKPAVGSEGEWETVAYQFHTPGGDYNEAYAAALDRVIVPVSDPDSGCGNYDADPTRRPSATFGGGRSPSVRGETFG